MSAFDGRDRRIGFAIPGDSGVLQRAISGGYAYDRRLISGLTELGIETIHIPVPAAYPAATPAQQASARTALTGFDGPLLVDGLCLCAVEPEVAEEIGPRTAALIHHPMHLELGLPAVAAEALEIRERAMVTAARRVIVTSAATADSVAEIFEIDHSSVVVAEPGVDPSPRAPVSGATPLIVSVGAAIPRKGFPFLIDAMSLLADLDWRLEIIGPLDPDPEHAAMIGERIAEAGLSDRAQMVGALSASALTARYQGADIFVSAAELEGYGMAVAEAINAGLPVAAASETVWAWAPHVERIERPADGPAIATALRPLLESPSSRRAAAEASWTAAASLPRWDLTAQTVARAFEGLWETIGEAQSEARGGEALGAARRR